MFLKLLVHDWCAHLAHKWAGFCSCIVNIKALFGWQAFITIARAEDERQSPAVKLDQEQAKTLQYPFAGQLSRVNNGIDFSCSKKWMRQFELQYRFQIVFLWLLELKFSLNKITKLEIVNRPNAAMLEIFRAYKISRAHIMSRIWGLRPIYSRLEYCKKYSIWCTDWPNYNVRSQSTRRLIVQDDGLGTRIWTIRLFIPNSIWENNAQNFCRKSFLFLLLSLTLLERIRHAWNAD